MLNEQLKRDFARRVFEIGVFKDITKSPEGKGFRLKIHEKEPDAPLSPFYLDYRLLQSDYDAKRMAVQLFYQMLQAVPVPDRLAAIPEAIVPVVSSLSDTTRIPMVTPRATKGHGSGSRVDGLWQPRMTAALFDDVVAGADSKLEVLSVCRGVEFIIGDVFVLTDRQQGSKEQLAKAGLTLHAAFTLEELLKSFCEQRLITSQALGQIEEYLAPIEL